MFIEEQSLFGTKASARPFLQATKVPESQNIIQCTRAAIAMTAKHKPS